MQFDLRAMASFGVAGNFTGHLEQAGEARDFTNVKTAEANAPKALFPTFMPKASSAIPDYLSVFPFDAYRVIFPDRQQNLQIEPEMAIICDVTWERGQVTALQPIGFGASNDCSIRKEGARKIKKKKNWGASSKGFATNVLPIDRFVPGGILDKYRIASFLVREGEVYEYGEDSAVRDYSYFYQKLITWCIDKLNHQQDAGPAEHIHEYLVAAGCPTRILISVGATRYTPFGESHYLQKGDQAVVVLYPEDVYAKEEIIHRVKRDNLEEDDISLLQQMIV